MASRRGSFLLARAGMVALCISVVSPAAPAAAAAPPDTYIVVGKADPAALEQAGFHVTGGLQEAGVLIVEASDPSGLASVPGVLEFAKDALNMSLPADDTGDAFDASALDAAMASAPPAPGCSSAAQACRLQWDLARIHAPEAWATTKGAGVKVAVLDTGVRSAHSEVVGSNYDLADSISFVRPNPVCAADSAPTLEDLNGHGTWTATHIAGKNGTLMSGIAPDASFVNVRVLGACGVGAESWLLQGMLYGLEVGAQVENLSLGGYICGEGFVAGSFHCGQKGDPSFKSQQALWHAFQHVVDYLKARGTVVVAAAGNEHVQLDRSGQVVSHGSAAACKPALNACNDLYGMTLVPGGIPHVIAVGAVNRVTGSGAASETKFGQYGAGLRDQVAFYSSYGSRIDFWAPGGARNYNVPSFDCRSARCARLDPAGFAANGFFDNPGDFGASGLANNAYVDLQGTSMAAPQVAGAATLAIASHPGIHAEQLIKLLGSSVTAADDPNATPGIENDPGQPTFGFDIDYDGPAIDAGAAGVIDAALAVSAP
jgi:subtilisin family serine protease